MWESNDVMDMTHSYHQFYYSSCSAVRRLECAQRSRLQNAIAIARMMLFLFLVRHGTHAIPRIPLCVCNHTSPARVQHPLRIQAPHHLLEHHLLQHHHRQHHHLKRAAAHTWKVTASTRCLLCVVRQMNRNTKTTTMMILIKSTANLIHIKTIRIPRMIIQRMP